MLSTGELSLTDAQGIGDFRRGERRSKKRACRNRCAFLRNPRRRRATVFESTQRLSSIPDHEHVVTVDVAQLLERCDTVVAARWSFAVRVRAPLPEPGAWDLQRLRSPDLRISNRSLQMPVRACRLIVGLRGGGWHSSFAEEGA